MDTRREYAIISGIGPKPTSHWIGWPPELAGHEPRQLLPLAAVVYLVVEPDGIYALRYADDGSFVGDTWHQSIDDAWEQVGGEFVVSAGGWNSVPEDVTDLSAFALSVLEES